MASMAATSRLTIRGFESVSLPPRSSSLLRTQISSVSRAPKRFSVYYTGRRNVGLVKIRAMCSDSSGAGLEEDVKKTVGGNPVVVYSKTWCS
ncbi:UNVERIFIED_CONTAM: hypothetical protein Sradi_1382300, partial [Sesamum radiatum]